MLIWPPYSSDHKGISSNPSLGVIIDLIGSAKVGVRKILKSSKILKYISEVSHGRRVALKHANGILNCKTFSYNSLGTIDHAIKFLYYQLNDLFINCQLINWIYFVQGVEGKIDPRQDFRSDQNVR